MPRRPPSAVRASRAGRTRRLDDQAVADALRRYRDFLRQPGRWLCPPSGDSLQQDPVDSRDVLEQALTERRGRARADLRAQLAPLDEEFERRTLPDPYAEAISPWHAAAWWRRRIRADS